MWFNDFVYPNILQLHRTINALQSIYQKTSRKKYNQLGISLGVSFIYFGAIVKLMHFKNYEINNFQNQQPMRPLLILSLFLVTLFSCKSQQYTSNDLPDNQLVFGRGGGISGEINTYTLLENGQFFYNNSFTKENAEIKSLTKKEATSYFQKMAVLQLSEMNFNHPGNLYYFLEEVNGGERHRVTWGSNDHTISEKCKAFYKELRTLIK